MDKFTSFFTIDVWTIIFSLGNLLIIFLVMKKFLFKPVQDILDARDKQIHEDLDSAKAAKVEAEAMKSQYEGLLANARDESDSIIKAANRKASLDGEQILQEAQAQAAEIVKRGEQQVEMERRQAYLDVKEDVSNMAVSIASAVVERELSEDDHRDMIDKIIGNLGE